MSDEHDRQDGAAPLEIEVEGLRKTFGRREVLKGLSFSLERGGFLSIFGPNGAGKTTTLRVLATLLTPSAGRITVAGHDVREDPMPVRRAIGLYALARPGLGMVDAGARPCLEVAFTLYRRILHRVIDNDFNVFEHRLVVPPWQRLATAGHVGARAVSASLIGVIDRRGTPRSAHRSTPTPNR